MWKSQMNEGVDVNKQTHEWEAPRGTLSRTYAKALLEPGQGVRLCRWWEWQTLQVAEAVDSPW